MCAMKEVTLFSDDAKSKESAKQLAQVSLSYRKQSIEGLMFVDCLELFILKKRKNVCGLLTGVGS